MPVMYASLNNVLFKMFKFTCFCTQAILIKYSYKLFNIPFAHRELTLMKLDTGAAILITYTYNKG